MNSTLDEFKIKQEKAINILQELQIFIEEGQNYKINIDKTLKSKLEKSINNLETSKLSVALIGGFSEGKTSIAAAWTEKLDKESMNITHEESSNEVKVYNIDDKIELVDTPGLFGFKEKTNASTAEIETYKEITKKYISEAHLVLYIMNSVNPIKESHNNDLNWLFRTLNLLPRTIFVLSKFDEIADLEDDNSFKEEYDIKKLNIIKRLHDEIKLSDDEKNELSIVAVSANPFDMGIEHWLNNLNKFKKLSHIKDLQEITKNKIKNYGGIEEFAFETKHSIIKDILNTQLPSIKKLNNNLNNKIEEFNDRKTFMQKELLALKNEIKGSKINLRQFAVDYFSDLILQLNGTSIETIYEFFEREIGSKGINLETTLKNKFDQELEQVNLKLENIKRNFNAETNSLHSSFHELGKKGLIYLKDSNIINNQTILTTRDAISNGMKVIGFDVSKYLTFKPWGAVNLAKNLNGVLAVLSIGLELLDSYKQSEKEKEFNIAKNKMKENFEKQKEEIIALLSSENFINNFFPSYLLLEKNMLLIEEDIQNINDMQKQIAKWEEKGKSILTKISKT